MVFVIVLLAVLLMQPICYVGDEGNLMATYGSIGDFNASIDDWTSYTERLEQYFTVTALVQIKLSQSKGELFY